MLTKIYTDDFYVPINELRPLGEDVVRETNEYRKRFIEFVPLGPMEFVNIVETPALIRKRYTKNVAIKGAINLIAPNNDYILEIAKALVTKREVNGIHVIEREKLIEKYRANDNDLTIITSYLADNVERLIANSSKSSLERSIPELTKSDCEFINRFHDLAFSYSIEDYRTASNCSYETARKGLERLVMLDLYKNIKVGKKFIYKPQPKLASLLAKDGV